MFIKKKAGAVCENPDLTEYVHIKEKRELNHRIENLETRLSNLEKLIKEILNVN